ncbi:MAG: flippase-like domain-containing protein [Myxococcota bacterium]|nr:flippase-like domain-containing protein [Myxococcota bacterium]
MSASDRRPRPARFAWRVALTLGATCLVIAVVCREVGTSAELVAALNAARLQTGATVARVTVAFSISSACVLVGVVRWQLVLSAMGHRLSFGRALEAVLATWPLAVVSPSRANELLRAIVVRDVVPIAVGTGSLLTEKALDLLILLVLAACGAALRTLWIWLLVIVGLIGVELSVIVVVWTRRRWVEGLPVVRRWRGELAELLVGLDGLAIAPLRLVAAGVMSLAIRVMTVAVIHALLGAVGADVRFVDTMTLWPLAMLVGLAPLTLAGVGTRDAAFIALLEARAGVVSPSAVLVATMGYSVVAIGSFAIIGLPLMARLLLGGSRKRRTL